MINLTEKQKEQIIITRCGKIEIDQKKYYYKPVLRHVEGVELLIEKLANLVDINCAHYERIEIEGMPYMLSEDIAKNKVFKTANEVIDTNSVTGSLYDIWNTLEKKYPNDIEWIMNEIVKIYIFDILILQSDRSLGNWGILFDGDRVDKVYILDNEYSFDGLSPVILNSHYGDELNDKKDDKYLNNMKNLENFLNYSDPEFILLFKKIYNILTPDVVKKCMVEVELNVGNNYRLNREMFYTYVSNYYEIANLCNKRGLK